MRPFGACSNFEANVLFTITRSIVEAHGGRIWAASLPGEATTFHVELPIWAENHAEQQEHP